MEKILEGIGLHTKFLNLFNERLDMIFNKNNNILFRKEKSENKIKIQIPPTFKKRPGYQKPWISTNILNSRIKKIMTPIKNITNTLNLASILIISKYNKVTPTTAKGINSNIDPRENLITNEYLIKIFKFQ